MCNKDRSPEFSNERTGIDAGGRADLEIPQERRSVLLDVEQARPLLDHLGKLLPAAQRAAFQRASLSPPPPSLRLNPLMPLPATLRAALEAQGDKVAWCPDAFALPDCPHRLGHTLEYVVGAVYVQAKAATFAVEALCPHPDEKVLDMAAAPGGKATQIAAKMDNTGLLMVNELHSNRLPALVGNLERCGVANAVVSRAYGTSMAHHFHNYFDRVLLDAPCSGDGILCKDRQMLRYWSVDDARRKAQHQIGLLRAGFHMLRPGGTLVYSTCSLSLEENEDVLLGLMKKFPKNAQLRPIKEVDGQPLPTEQASAYPPEFVHAVRIWPHLHNTEGAFVAKVGKRVATQPPGSKSTAPEWLRPTEAKANPTSVLERLESLWKFTMPIPDGQSFSLEGRQLHLRPQAASEIRENYPFFIRAGMRVARSHRDHFYLSQQAVTMWAERMQKEKLPLSWPQVQELFRTGELMLPQATSFKGEVICSHGPYALCRALVSESGHRLDGMIPKDSLRAELVRLA